MSSRYESIPSHDPNYKFMVWDWDENMAICYCWDRTHCDKIAFALNLEVINDKTRDSL